MRRAATIQDISCAGKCSLTVALPIISAMGIETCVIPTAVLSNHTAFADYTIRDLTEDIPGILKRWEEERFLFDAVYSGYLASIRQIDLILQSYQMIADEHTLKIVDPAMADFGKLYAGFNQAFVEKMRLLTAKADVITPNLTECCFLTDTPYREDFSRDETEEILRKLGARGTPYIIMTGAGFSQNEIGAILYDTARDEFTLYTNRKIPVTYHGTGDIFASCLTGGLVRGLSPQDAMKLAVDFDLECIRRTIADPDRHWYGVNFEQALPWLVQRLQSVVQ